MRQTPNSYTKYQHINKTQPTHIQNNDTTTVSPIRFQQTTSHNKNKKNTQLSNQSNEL